MKTNKILAFFTVIAMSIALVSCVQDDDFTVPTSLSDEENAGLADLLNTATEVSIADVKAMYNADPNNDGDNDTFDLSNLSVKELKIFNRYVMEVYSKKLEVRWADLDPNFHVLHSKYYDFGAYCRLSFFNENAALQSI